MATACANAEMLFHDAANIFPLDDENIAALADDIRQHGQQVAIELMDGMVLDGRRRWLACKLAGVKPVTREVVIADPVAYVLSLNLHRRHLSPSQLAMVGGRATSLREKLAEEAAARQKSGKKNLGENFPQGRTADTIGKLVGVSGKSVDHATRVLKHGEPELIKAVDEGRMAVSTAAFLATEPPERQAEEIAKRNRLYVPGVGTCGRPRRKPEEQAPEEPQDEGERRSVGVGVIRANEAINCLTRIPKNDALRKRGFQIVTDWIRRNS